MNNVFQVIQTYRDNAFIKRKAVNRELITALVKMHHSNSTSKYRKPPTK